MINMRFHDISNNFFSQDEEEKALLREEESKQNKENELKQQHHEHKKSHHHHKKHHHHNKKDDEPAHTGSNNHDHGDISDVMSTTSAKVIEVQSITDDNLKDDKLSAVDNLENAPKDETKAQDAPAAGSAEDPGADIAVEDILSLEKILIKELANISTSKLSWQTSPDKKSKLCIFFVR